MLSETEVFSCIVFSEKVIIFGALNTSFCYCDYY